MSSRKLKFDLSASQLAFLSAFGGGLIVVGSFAVFQYTQRKKEKQSQSLFNQNDNDHQLSNPRLEPNYSTHSISSQNELFLKYFPGMVRSQHAWMEFEKESTKYPIENQIEMLKEQNSYLLNVLNMVESTQCNDESNVLTPNDIETLRAFFNSVDKDQDGHITEEEFGDLFHRLGEPLNEEEIKTNFSNNILNPDNLQTIIFSNFLTWWQASHNGNKKGQQYYEKFKFARAKLCGNFDLNRLRIQPVEHKGTTEFRIYFSYKTSSGAIKRISPWHDIPLHHLNIEKDKLYHFISEIPKWTRAKYEIATGEDMNPIHQEVINGKLRYYQYGDMMFNYGALPQTWEDPEYIDEKTQCPGDNDPLDCIEFGTRQLPTGSVTPVKILGVLGLLDRNETDWKILAINIDDPLANLLHDCDDFDKYMPGAIEAIREFLRIYKVAQDKFENQYAFRGEALNKEFAIKVIEQSHNHWKRLYAKKANE